ncbi:MAG: polysaccharide export protein [Mucilaginibacter sp.]|nr:polysaccharide export protein [Mucilaginibacter sp.]
MSTKLTKLNRFIWVILCLPLVAGSCSSNRNLVYFSDMQNSTKYTKNVTKLLEDSQPKIQPNDLLNIRVNTISAESNTLFNNISYTNSNNYDLIKSGYRVDRAGDISFPVLGQVKVGGLSIDEAKIKLVKILSDYTKNPVVNLDFINFKVTVIGEVLRPGTYTVTDESITLLGALGLAGDMTPYAKRNNVLIVRENNGIRTTERINLNSSEIFESKYYYLKQNDIIYVEPDKAKVLQTDQNNRFIPIIAASMSVIAVVVSILLRN